MRAPLAAAILALGLLAACGGNDDGEPSPAPTVTAATATPTPEPTPTATATPTPTPTPTPSPPPTPTPTPPGDPSLAETLAGGAGYFLYEAGGGETTDVIAAALGLDGAELRALNGIGVSPLAAGQAIAIPNPYAGGELAPVAVLETVLGIDRASPGLRLLRPGADLIDGLLGRLALHRLRLVLPGGADGAGYLLEFARTDRPALKGGVPDPEARTAGAAFAVAGGSLAGALEERGAHAFTRDGAPYAVLASDRAGPSAEQIAALLVGE